MTGVGALERLGVLRNIHTNVLQLASSASGKALLRRLMPKAPGARTTTRIIDLALLVPRHDVLDCLTREAGEAQARRVGAEKSRVLRLQSIGN